MAAPLSAHSKAAAANRAEFGGGGPLPAAGGEAAKAAAAAGCDSRPRLMPLGFTGRSGVAAAARPHRQVPSALQLGVLWY